MKISLIFNILKHSVTSIKKYNHLLLLSNKTIVIYFFFWVSILSVLQAFHFATTSVPQTISGLTSAFEQGIEHYPEDLTFNWNGSDTVTSNYETVELYYPSNVSPSEYYLPERLGTFVNTEVTPGEEYSNYLMVGTPTMLHFQEGPELWNSFEYATFVTDVPETDLTKSDVQWLYQQWLQERDSLQTTVQVVSVVIKTITGIVFDTITLLIRAIFLLLLIKFLARLKTTYKRVLKLAALLTVPALIVETLILFLYGTDVYGLGGFTFWLLFMLYMWFGKVVIRKKPTA